MRDRIFDCRDEEGSFEAYFVDMLKKLSEDDRLRTGIIPSELGTHSIRKGACSFLLGLVGVVCISAVYLRMGWSLGNVQKRYIFGGPGSDQVLGRTIAALDCTSPRFALLPPHFTQADTLSIQQWEEAVPGFSLYPEQFRIVIPYLVASVVFHIEWLKKTLPSSHPLFLSRFYRNNYCAFLGCLKNSLLGSFYIKKGKILLQTIAQLLWRALHHSQLTFLIKALHGVVEFIQLTKVFVSHNAMLRLCGRYGILASQTTILLR
jgi:hypothetical protein